MTVDYRDPSHIKDGDVKIDKTKVSTEVSNLAHYIRTKMYGIDVRESLALAIELMNNIVVDDMNAFKKAVADMKKAVDELAKHWDEKTGELERHWNDETGRLVKQWDQDSDELNREWQKKLDELTDHWDSVVGGITDDSEIIDARTNIKGKTFLTLKQHLDDMEMTSISGQLTDYTVEADYVLKIRDLGVNTDSLKYDEVANMANQSDNNYALIVMGVRNLVLEAVAN